MMMSPKLPLPILKLAVCMYKVLPDKSAEMCKVSTVIGFTVMEDFYILRIRSEGCTNFSDHCQLFSSRNSL